MWNILGWVVAGLIIGAIARLLVPGRQPMGLLMTSVLGIVGALIGGFISFIFWGAPGASFGEYAWPGYLCAIIGSVVLLLLVGPTASSVRRS